MSTPQWSLARRVLTVLVMALIMWGLVAVAVKLMMYVLSVY